MTRNPKSFIVKNVFVSGSGSNSNSGGGGNTPGLALSPDYDACVTSFPISIPATSPDSLILGPSYFIFLPYINNTGLRFCFGGGIFNNYGEPIERVWPLTISAALVNKKTNVVSATFAPQTVEVGPVEYSVWEGGFSFSRFSLITVDWDISNYVTKNTFSDLVCTISLFRNDPFPEGDISELLFGTFGGYLCNPSFINSGNISVVPGIPGINPFLPVG